MNLDLPLLNHFLRLAMGGWDCLPVKDEYQIKHILPLIQQLDPNERFWHVEDDTIWKIDPWKQLWEKTLERRALREEQQLKVDARKAKMEELTKAVMDKFHLPSSADVEKLALTILRQGAADVAKEFGVDIRGFEDMDKPYEVIEEGRVVSEY